MICKTAYRSSICLFFRLYFGGIRCGYPSPRGYEVLLMQFLADWRGVPRSGTTK